VISQNVANFWNYLANIGVIVGALLTAISVVVQIWTGSIKETYDEQKIEDTKIELGKAKESALEAHSLAGQYAAQLENYLALRAIKAEYWGASVETLKQYSGFEYNASLSSSGEDVQVLWRQLDQLLTESGWSRIAPAGISSGFPPAGVMIGQFEGSSIGVGLQASNEVKAAAQDLARVLTESGIQTQLVIGQDHKEKNAQVITLRIGAKPRS
jgi:phosphoglucomutase